MSTDYIRSIQLRFYFLSFLILANSAQAACVGSDVVICSGSSSVAYTNSVSITSLTLETGGAITSPIDKAIINYANIGTLTNNGTIAGSAWYGIWNWYWSTPVASIGTIINNGIIYGPSYGIFNEIGTIGTITNIGTIYGGGTAGKWGIVIDNSTASLSVLNNLQGQSNTYGALNYAGKLPTNYNIIISPTSFGQLAVTGGTGSTAFGIFTGSTVTSGVYADVLQGLVGSLSGSSITGTGFSITGTTGSYGAFNYSLVADTANTGMWNLVLTAASTNILSGATNLLSGLGGSLNPVFDGGILKVDASGRNSTAFTITTAGGVIDQRGMSPVFVGGFADSAVGVHGKLTIINSGTGGSVGLAGVNTYSGGTEVDAGANLAINSASSIGTGALALVGTSTTSATLTTTANMTISNPITVTGDPVFYVVSGTTTTVSSPITDGGSSGDVVVSGGGTLALTAANTYTGLTAINAGSTLALVGAGSITTSSALNNSGTVDVRSVSGKVALGGTFAQTSTGSLLMNISPTNNQQINVTGAAALAGGLSLNATAGTYAAGKYTLLTANGVTGTFGTFASNLSSYTRLGYALGYDANDVYLYLTPNVADTQQSLANNVSALQNIFTLQNSVLANSFSYDCTVFGANDICVSAGGRNTTVQAANGLNNTSALLIAAYRPHPNYRIGAYADQNLSMNNSGSTVNLGNNTPLIGLFGAWNENADGTGTEVKAGIAYGQKNATVTRQVVNTSEPGTGSSQLNSQGAQVTAKYGFGIMENVIVSPYVGVRYTQNNMGGYTEGTSSTVTAPLTYSALNTNSTTALAGVGASYRVIPTVMTFASAGVETDTNTANGSYSASGVTGLTPINFNPNPVRTRPTATVGAYYDIEKNQRLGITGIYRQEPYQAVSTTTVLATYTVGL